MNDECGNEVTWSISPPDGDSLRVCDLHLRDALQAVMDEHGDGASVQVWMVQA